MTWLEPWYSILDNADQIAGMERQLHAEVPAGHALHSLPVRALARRQDCDDVLFGIEDGTGRVAVVHLTWSSGLQPPDYPRTTIFLSLDEWRVDGMQVDHDVFTLPAE
jgi:hypothetical protein